MIPVDYINALGYREIDFFLKRECAILLTPNELAVGQIVFPGLRILSHDNNSFNSYVKHAGKKNCHIQTLKNQVNSKHCFTLSYLRCVTRDIIWAAECVATHCSLFVNLLTDCMTLVGNLCLFHQIWSFICCNAR